MPEKRYRRKRNEFEVIGFEFGDLEKGPVVVIQSDDSDATDVPWAEWKRDFEEVPQEGVGGDSKPTVQEAFLASVTDRLGKFLANYQEYEKLAVKGRHDGIEMGVHEMDAILAAARRSPAAIDKPCRAAAKDEPTERCRVGEAMPAARLTIGKQGGLMACCTWVDVNEERVGFMIGEVQRTCGLHAWDDAREEWIADGRPV